MSQVGVAATETDGAATLAIPEQAIQVPDLLPELQERTQLTGRTIHRVVPESGRTLDFMQYPQEFVCLAPEAINRCKRLPG